MCRDVYHTQGNNPKLKLQSLSVLASFLYLLFWQKKSDRNLAEEI